MQTVILSWMLLLGALNGAGNFPVDMFETTSHQFGTVMRGATTEYEFVFTNRYVEDVIVESVRSSCQCTTPTLLTRGPIKTGQQGRIKIHINTQNFTGNKNATITVRFAAPRRVEMQLHSYVYIRSDVSVTPGIAYFGSVDLERNPRAGVSVNVNSVNSNWRIVDVQSDCKFLSVELGKPTYTYQGTSYNLVIRFRENAPAGPFSEVLELVTNDYDQRSQRIPVRVEGRVKQTLSASPSPFSFSMVEKGNKVQKTIVIQGAEPFQILDIKSEDRNITASIEHVAKKIQPIKLTYTGNQLGDFQGSITVVTDLEGGMTTSVNFSGKVIPESKPVAVPEEPSEVKPNPDASTQLAPQAAPETPEVPALPEAVKDEPVVSSNLSQTPTEAQPLPEQETSPLPPPAADEPVEEIPAADEPVEEIPAADEPVEEIPAADEPVGNLQEGEIPEILPNDIEEVPETVPEVGTASETQKKPKGRNLLKK